MEPIDSFMPRKLLVGPASAGRQPAEFDRKRHDEQQADPESRHAEAEHGQAHDEFRRDRIGLVAGPQPERNSEQVAIIIAAERELERRREAGEDQAHDGKAIDERFAEVAAQHVAHEDEILLDQRAVEAIALDEGCRAGPDRRPDRSSRRSGCRWHRRQRTRSPTWR